MFTDQYGDFFTAAHRNDRFCSVLSVTLRTYPYYHTCASLGRLTYVSAYFISHHYVPHKVKDDNHRHHHGSSYLL